VNEGTWRGDDQRHVTSVAHVAAPWWALALAALALAALALAALALAALALAALALAALALGAVACGLDCWWTAGRGGRR